jgi:hypothetical protein
MLCHVALVRTDGLEECIAFIIRVKSINELETALAVISNRSTLQRNICELGTTLAVSSNQSTPQTNASSED